MAAVRNLGVTIGVVATTLGLVLIGGGVGVAQDPGPGASPPACPTGSPAASPAAAAASPMASPGASPAAGEACPPADSGAAATTVEIESIDIDFLPEQVTIPANTDGTVVIDNTTAQIPHNFSVDELDINETYQAGETVEITVNAPPGSYEYYCNIPGHKPAGMFGNLIVQ